jgi:hypothetical protein
MQPYIEGADGSPVASCGDNAPGVGCYAIETFRRRDANAALIAAAPDLLDELRHMVEAYVVTYGEDCPAVERARAAIARAEGRS